MHCRHGIAAALAIALVPAPAAAGDIRIGFLGGVTGPIARLAPAMIDGAQLALRHVNEQGGLLGGSNGVLVIGDGACVDTAKAAEAADRLVNGEKVVAIVGGLCSGETIAAANKAAIPGGVAMIAPSSTSPAITALNDNDLVFRTAVSDAYQGEVLARLAAAAGARQIAVGHVNNDYGAGLARSLDAAFAKSGGAVVAKVAYDDGKADFRAEIGALAAARARDVAIIGYAEGSGASLLRQALESGSFERYFADDGMASERLATELGSRLEGRLFMTRPGAPDLAGAEHFRKLAAEAGIKADGVFVANSYDAAFIVALAIEQAGSADRAAIARAIRDVAAAPGETIRPGEWAKAVEAIKSGKGVNYEGASGNVDFDANGDVSPPFVRVEMKDGRLVETGEAK